MAPIVGSSWISVDEVSTKVISRAFLPEPTVITTDDELMNFTMPRIACVGLAGSGLAVAPAATADSKPNNARVAAKGGIVDSPIELHARDASVNSRLIRVNGNPDGERRPPARLGCDVD